MELDTLAVGEAHVSKCLGAKIIVNEPLFCTDAAARHFAPDHETPRFLELRLRALGADVAVILLIRAMVLKEDIRVVRDVRGASICKQFSELATEAFRGDFDLFDGGF